MTSTETSSFKQTDPKIGLSSTADPSSFAYNTARQRWPKILDQIIFDITSACKTLENDQDRLVGDQIKSQIASLKQEVANNGILSLLPEDGEPDIPDYNAELTSLGDPTWLNAPWLFAECYLYRLLHQFLAQSSSPYWQTFDVFSSSKWSSLVSSKKGTIELIKHFNGIIAAIQKNEAIDEATQKAIFEEMVQISLWGNATDLSLLQGVSMDQLDSIQGQQAREASKANVLVDEISAAFTLLTSLKAASKAGEIHYVLDNAGFELLTDLVFASYLLASGYAAKIILHGKRMPWFVSDVNAHDLNDLVNGFAKGDVYSDLCAEDKQCLKQAGEHWHHLLDTETLVFEAHPFWTTPHPFGRMATVAPELYEQLANGELVIYKGDLNYRKLTYDGVWHPHSTPFREAIGPLAGKQDGMGLRTFALRTAKADVAVGIPDEKLKGLPDDWTYSGKWAMVQYWDGKG